MPSGIIPDVSTLKLLRESYGSLPYLPFISDNSKWILREGANCTCQIHQMSFIVAFYRVLLRGDDANGSSIDSASINPSSLPSFSTLLHHLV